MELQTDRPQTMGGPAEIPFSSIYYYAQAYGFYGEDFEELHLYIRKMDRTWLKFRQGERQQKEAQKNNKKGMVTF